jgi:hypothetical protein
MTDIKRDISGLGPTTSEWDYLHFMHTEAHTNRLSGDSFCDDSALDIWAEQPDVLDFELFLHSHFGHAALNEIKDI